LLAWTQSNGIPDDEKGLVQDDSADLHSIPKSWVKKRDGGLRCDVAQIHGGFEDRKHVTLGVDLDVSVKVECQEVCSRHGLRARV
jgi:hypothetical protein